MAVDSAREHGSECGDGLKVVVEIGDVANVVVVVVVEVQVVELEGARAGFGGAVGEDWSAAGVTHDSRRWWQSTGKHPP